MTAQSKLREIEEKLYLTFELALLWAEGWIRDPVRSLPTWATIQSGMEQNDNMYGEVESQKLSDVLLDLMKT